MSWIVLGKFWACLVPEGLLDGQVMVIGRRFDRPVTEWTFRQEPLPPTKNNERKNAQTFMSLPLSSPYSGFCSSVKRFHIVSSLTSENNIARRLNLPGFRRFPRSAKSSCCNFSQFHFIYPDVASVICVLHFQRFRAPNSRAASQALMAWHRFRKHRLLRRPEETWRTLSKNRWSGARKHNVLNVLWLLTTNIFHINIYIYK